MVSDFRKKKLLFVFKTIFDADESGEVEKQDFDLFLERISKLLGWKESDVVYQVAQESLAKIWKGISCGADTDKDGKVTADEWLAMWDLPASVCRSCFNEWQKLFCKVFFYIQDKSSDGAVDCQEFVDVHAAIGLPKEEASEAFNKLSQGKSGVSWEDYQQLFKEFFIADDVNAPGNYIFGAAPFLK
ncbi:unnamed protein product [Colias eurytheme]|nr:unnamed protein product [Colias eurytheme]